MIRLGRQGYSGLGNLKTIARQPVGESGSPNPSRSKRLAGFAEISAEVVAMEQLLSSCAGSIGLIRDCFSFLGAFCTGTVCLS